MFTHELTAIEDRIAVNHGEPLRVTEPLSATNILFFLREVTEQERSEVTDITLSYLIENPDYINNLYEGQRNQKIREILDAENVPSEYRETVAQWMRNKDISNPTAALLEDKHVNVSALLDVFPAQDDDEESHQENQQLLDSYGFKVKTTDFTYDLADELGIGFTIPAHEYITLLQQHNPREDRVTVQVLNPSVLSCTDWYNPEAVTSTGITTVTIGIDDIQDATLADTDDMFTGTMLTCQPAIP